MKQTDNERTAGPGTPGPAGPRLLLTEDPADREKAAALAEQLGLKAVFFREETETETVWLALCRDGLALTDGAMTLRGDLAALIPRLRPDRLGGELLVRAARIRGASGALTAVDATAGLGEDALLLAASGFRVRMYERDPVIAALLADALERAERVPELAGPVSRMTLLREDSRGALEKGDLRPDVVYLDPMFPEKTKSALTGKKFQLLHRLAVPCAEEEALLRAALAARPRRVVVKRPLKGPWLAGVRPGHTIRGNAVRNDCLVPPPDPKEEE